MFAAGEIIQGGSNMTGTDLCVNKSQFVPVIFEPPCIFTKHCNIPVHERVVANCLVEVAACFQTFVSLEWVDLPLRTTRNPVPENNKRAVPKLYGHTAL
jgi:hypothetical protein